MAAKEKLLLRICSRGPQGHFRSGCRIEVPLGTYFLILGKPHQLEENEGKPLQLSDPRQHCRRSAFLAGRERSPGALRKTLRPERTSVPLSLQVVGLCGVFLEDPMNAFDGSGSIVALHAKFHGRATA